MFLSAPDAACLQSCGFAKGGPDVGRSPIGFRCVVFLPNAGRKLRIMSLDRLSNGPTECVIAADIASPALLQRYHGRYPVAGCLK